MNTINGSTYPNESQQSQQSQQSKIVTSKETEQVLFKPSIEQQISKIVNNQSLETSGAIKALDALYSDHHMNEADKQKIINATKKLLLTAIDVNYDSIHNLQPKNSASILNDLDKMSEFCSKHIQAKIKDLYKQLKNLQSVITLDDIKKEITSKLNGIIEKSLIAYLFFNINIFYQTVQQKNQGELTINKEDSLLLKQIKTLFNHYNKDNANIKLLNDLRTSLNDIEPKFFSPSGDPIDQSTTEYFTALFTQHGSDIFSVNYLCQEYTNNNLNKENLTKSLIQLMVSDVKNYIKNNSFVDKFTLKDYLNIENKAFEIWSERVVNITKALETFNLMNDIFNPINQHLFKDQKLSSRIQKEIIAQNVQNMPTFLQSIKKMKQNEELNFSLSDSQEITTVKSLFMFLSNCTMSENPDEKHKTQMRNGIAGILNDKKNFPSPEKAYETTQGACFTLCSLAMQGAIKINDTINPTTKTEFAQDMAIMNLYARQPYIINAYFLGLSVNELINDAVTKNIPLSQIFTNLIKCAYDNDLLCDFINYFTIQNNAKNLFEKVNVFDKGTFNAREIAQYCRSLKAWFLQRKPQKMQEAIEIMVNQFAQGKLHNPNMKCSKIPWGELKTALDSLS